MVHARCLKVIRNRCRANLEQISQILALARAILSTEVLKIIQVVPSWLEGGGTNSAWFHFIINSGTD